jgi:hypothetical protein
MLNKQSHAAGKVWPSNFGVDGILFFNLISRTGTEELRIQNFIQLPRIKILSLQGSNPQSFNP